MTSQCHPDHLNADTTKRATVSLLRSLTILSSTLEPLPGVAQVANCCFGPLTASASAYLNMRLYFSDNCPEDYQPQGFIVRDP